MTISDWIGVGVVIACSVFCWALAVWIGWKA